LTGTTATYALSLHDALPVCRDLGCGRGGRVARDPHVQGSGDWPGGDGGDGAVGDHGGVRESMCSSATGRYDYGHEAPYRHFAGRSEEHTSELQSRFDLVCRL